MVALSKTAYGTKNTLEKRYKTHQYDFKIGATKSKYRTSFVILKYDDVRIELIEDYPTTSKFFLELREGRLILDTDCVNIYIPRRKYQHLNPETIVDPTIDDYLKGKIYKITSPDTNDIYVGSTTQTLKQRFKDHYKNYKNGHHTTASHILKHSDVKIELIQDYPTTSEYFLLARERYWIEQLDCVNHNLPSHSQKEYRDDNKEKIKQHRDNNKEKYSAGNKERSKQYRKEHKTEVVEYAKKYDEMNKEKISNRKKKIS